MNDCSYIIICGCFLSVNRIWKIFIECAKITKCKKGTYAVVEVAIGMMYRGEENGLLVFGIIIFCNFSTDIRMYFCQYLLSVFGAVFSSCMGRTSSMGLERVSFLEAS